MIYKSLTIEAAAAQHVEKAIRLLRGITRDIELLYAGEDDLSDHPEYCWAAAALAKLSDARDAISPVNDEFKRGAGAEIIDLATYPRRAQGGA